LVPTGDGHVHQPSLTLANESASDGEVVNALRPTDPETVELILSNDVIEQNSAERAALRVLQAREKFRDWGREFVTTHTSVPTGKEPFKARFDAYSAFWLANSIELGRGADKDTLVGDCWRRKRHSVQAVSA
jgi:hypothetical protein